MKEGLREKQEIEEFEGGMRMRACHVHNKRKQER